MAAIPSIRPSSDLRNHYADISRACRETGEPTVLTVNGRGDTVIMSVEQYNGMLGELSIVSSVLKASRDAVEGHEGPIEESFARVRDRIAGRASRAEQASTEERAA